jgi:hypothetical protein
MPAAANAGVTITFTGTSPVPGINDFQSELSGLGLDVFTTTGATINLDENSIITFEYLGSESGFLDTFTAGSVSGNETGTPASPTNNFLAPVLLGSDVFTAGDLAGILNFTSSGGAAATVGDAGFGIFLGANDMSGLMTNVFYLGYDDRIDGDDDDNHDDFIIRATVTPAVPEPATWAMMLLGFGAVGFTMRRHRRPALLQVA